MEWKDKTTYKVTIKVSLDIPKSEKIDRVRVIHTLPLLTEWSKGDKKSGAWDISSEPRGGRIKVDKNSGSSYIEWEQRVPSAGGQFEFTTTYKTISVTRYIPENKRGKARWKSRGVVSSGIHPEILELARTLIKEDNPVDAFEKFSVWLEQRISYDASVPNTLAFDEIMEGGRGHCGHRLSVTRHFAKALGIPFRAGGGATLLYDDSSGQHPIHQIKPISANSHVWAELDIPGIGLVEAEPSGKDKMFEIPHSFVQTRGIAQNYKVEILQGGRWTSPGWITEEHEGGRRFVSPIGERSTIAYEILPAAGAPDQVLVADADTTKPAAGAGEEGRKGKGEGGEPVWQEPMGSQPPKAESAGDTGILSQTVTLDVTRNGFKIGQITLKPGAAVDILRERHGEVLIKRGSSAPRWVSLDMLTRRN